MQNTTNGAVTNYTINFTPNTPIFTGDKLSMKFPPEIGLPSQSNILCSGSKNLISIICTKSANN